MGEVKASADKNHSPGDSNLKMAEKQDLEMKFLIGQDHGPDF